MVWTHFDHGKCFFEYTLLCLSYSVYKSVKKTWDIVHWTCHIGCHEVIQKSFDFSRWNLSKYFAMFVNEYKFQIRFIDFWFGDLHFFVFWYRLNVVFEDQGLAEWKKKERKNICIQEHDMYSSLPTRRSLVWLGTKSYSIAEVTPNLAIKYNEQMHPFTIGVWVITAKWNDSGTSCGVMIYMLDRQMITSEVESYWCAPYIRPCAKT